MDTRKINQPDHSKLETRPGTACRKVLDMPELFDLIMLQLDQRSLLTCIKRVCRTWNTRIKESSSLQQALFYRSSNAGITSTDRNQGRRPYRNPLLAELFTGWLNFHDSGPVYKCLPAKNQFRIHPFPDRFTSHADASWRKMLVQQDPIANTIGMIWLTGDRSRNLWITAKLFTCVNHDGLRMGDYFDILSLQEDGHDCPLIFWPSGEVVEHAKKGELDARRAFLEFLLGRLPPNHPRRAEVEQQERKTIFEADIVFVTPFDVGQTPSAKKKDWDGKFRKGRRFPRRQEWDLAPMRGGFMNDFLGVEGTMGDEVKYGLRETYTWRAKVQNGFNINEWADEMHSMIFD